MLALSTDLQKKKAEVQTEQGRLTQLLEDLDELVSRKEKYTADLTELEEAFTVFQTLEGAWHKTFEQRLESLLSRNLSFVFNEPLEFILVKKTHGDMSALDFQIIQRFGDKSFQSNIKGAKGGGVVVVVSFLLRVLLLLAAQPKIRPILILDEVFAMVSQEFVPNLAQLVKELVDKTGIQVVLVTHEPMFAEYADVAYEVHMDKKGDSQYTKLEGTVKD